MHVEDLDDEAYVLVATTLPRTQTSADAVTTDGLVSLGLPATYPRDSSGVDVPRAVCRRIGEEVHAYGLRGVWCRSACTPDGQGRELAWFPATRRSQGRGVWDTPLPLGEWRDATSWADLGLDEQVDPHE